MKRIKLNKNGKKFFILSVFTPFVMAAMILGISGAWTSLRLWIFLGAYTVMGWATIIILWRANPELLNHRGEKKPDNKSWDRIYVSLMNLFTALVLPVIASLDIRLGWTSPVWGTPSLVVGYSLYGMAMIFTLWAMLTNRHFETNVRIQTDRDHKVIDTGPYAWIRHPGYFGTFIFWMSLPLILGSIWAFIPALAASVVMIARASREDHTLQEELTGYREYTNKVRYRIFYGIW